MIYFYWMTGLGFAIALTVLLCVGGEKADE